MEMSIQFVTGFFVVILAITFAGYIFTSATHAKALKLIGIEHTWVAWIPIIRWFAFADATVNNIDKTVRILNLFDCPRELYRFWWGMYLVFLILPINYYITSILNCILAAIFLGTSYMRVYNMLEHKKVTDSSNMVIGMMSGIFPIIACIKFCIYKSAACTLTKEERQNFDNNVIQTIEPTEKNSDDEELDK